MDKTIYSGQNKGQWKKNKGQQTQERAVDKKKVQWSKQLAVDKTRGSGLNKGQWTK